MLQSKYLRKEFSVKHEEFYWTAPDRHKLYAQCWNAGQKAKACILLVHGLGEHSSRYDAWANWLATEGFTVLSLDLRGHGKSQVKNRSINNYNIIVSDIDLLIKQGKSLCENKPVFLYGHGFGANLIVNFSINNTLNINGIILTSPWLELSKAPSRFQQLTHSILSRFAPYSSTQNHIKIEDLSKELKVVHLFRTDPLVRSKIPVKLFKQAYEKGLIAKRSIYKINVPILVLHGSEDKITSCVASKEFVMNASEKTKFVEIEGGFHELHNDSDKDSVFQTITNWLNNQIKE